MKVPFLSRKNPCSFSGNMKYPTICLGLFIAVAYVRWLKVIVVNASAELVTPSTRISMVKKNNGNRFISPFLLIRCFKGSTETKNQHSVVRVVC